MVVETKYWWETKPQPQAPPPAETLAETYWWGQPKPITPEPIEPEPIKYPAYTPITDEAGQAITLNLFPSDVGLGKEVLDTLFNVSYEGDEIVDWKPRIEGVSPAQLSFSVDKSTGNIAVMSEGEVVGQADSRTGELALDDKFISDVRSSYVKVYGKEIPVYTWGTQTPIQPTNKLGELLYKKVVIGEKILPAPAEVLGMVGLIGAIAIMGYQAIPVIKNALSSATKSVLDFFIGRHAKDILMVVQRGGAGTTKEQILYKIYNYHGHYIAQRAQEIFTQQRAVRAVPTGQLPLLESAIRTSTQTTDKVVQAVKTGVELTPASTQALIVSGTPPAFAQGINAIITGQAIAPAVAGIIPTVAETVALATGETFTTTVYRGFKTGIAPTDEGLVGKAQYWTTDPEYAATYGTVKSGTVELSNPLVIQMQSEWDAFAMRTRELRDQAIAAGKSEDWVQSTLRKQLVAEGYDGVVITEGIVERGTQVAVFHPAESISLEVPTTVAAAEWETVTGAPILTEKQLRQSIMATVKTKGISETQYRKIFRDVGGSRYLTNLKADKLNEVLNAVRRARPIKIRGKIVIKPGTEDKIQSLKTSLINEGLLTEEAFTKFTEKLPTTRFETKVKFITEKEGRALIRQMNDEAEIGLVGWEARATKALEANPKVKELFDDNNARLEKAGRAYFEGKPIKVTEWADMRFVMDDLQTQSGGQFYDVHFRLNRQANANRMIFNESKRRQAGSTAQFKRLIQSKASMQRVNDYIASKNKWMDVKAPTDITTEEIKLANALEEQLFEFVPDYRYHRFLEIYKEVNGVAEKIKERIPDAPLEDIKVAINIYESQGTGRLRAYLDTRDWGVIESGFEPHFVVNPRFAMRRLQVLFPSGRFKSRTGVEYYANDMNVVQRTDRYTQQMLNYNLKPYVRKLEEIYQEVAPKLDKPTRVRRDLSLMLNHIMGYRDTSPMGQFLMKIASQAYITVFGTYPILPFRNLFQNLAFGPNKRALIDPRNKKLTDWDWQFYNAHISQMEAVPRDLLLVEGGGLPGLRRVNRFILKLNLYGASDSKINRVWCYWAHKNEAQRALTQFKKDGNIKKFIANSGMGELTLRQQNYVLQNLVMDEVEIAGLPTTDGGNAAISEVAAEITNNVHFLYDRSQRAFIEMGEMGRIAGSLLIFPRSVIQRTWWQIKSLAPGSTAPPYKKKQAMKVLLSMLLGSIVANYLFQKATGRKGQPYNPLNILRWQPGGLAIGSISNIAILVGDLFLAAGGDENAKGRVPSDISNAGDTFIPFYKLTMQALEAAVDKKQIDRLAYRELRAIIDEKLWEMGFLDKTKEGLYKPNSEFYEAERSWEWRIKHALFGTEEEEIPLKTAVSNLKEAQEKLGILIEAEDSDDGYVYQMMDFAADIRRNTFDIQPENITEENDFDPLVILYKEAETMWDEHYYSLPASERQDFIQRDNPTSIQVGSYLVLWGNLKATGWASGNPKTIAQVESLINQYNIPPEAVPSMGELKGEGEYWWGGTPTEPTEQPAGYWWE